jgi:hypothetical protein
MMSTNSLKFPFAAWVASSLMLLAASQATAGTLALSTNSLPAFTGSTSFDNGTGLDGSIDFAVYTVASGGLASDFPGNGYVPAVGDTHIYAYQVFNSGPGVSFISTQISAPIPLAAQGGIGAFEEVPANILPGASSFSGTSALWSFASPTIANGEESSILVYSSPLAPTSGFLVTINGGGTSATTGPVPGVQIPEPTSIALLGLAMMAVGVRRRR